jgi:cytochrome c-type protein NapC
MKSSLLISLLTLIVVCDAPIVQAADIDWGKVEAKNIKVFYPGVASWEFLTGVDHGTGEVPVKTIKKACADCHVGKDGTYDINADKIITGELKKVKSGGIFEPEPVAGAKGFNEVAVQVAYDAQNIYLRLQWTGSGASVADPSLAKDDKPDRISVQIADKIKTFNLYGCFIACHDDETGMPKHSGEEKKLYGYYAAGKPQDKLDGYLAQGQFVDLWEVYFEGPAVKTEDGYILESRHEDNNDLSATGSFENGKYTVVITRKLSTGDAKDIALQDGKAFSIGISVHDNKNKGRKHHVSFPFSVGLSAAGDVTAKKF